ncbi:hypothetical protein FEM48_Zijuj01G0028100 [Ziziphus jujuba var. spinosa]|uniref:Beta-glucosidase 12-like n=1 Tax=Ziziphus jujuba var. spinosa TaxID=714518 RepID=A0A978VYP9_ZIZJJ|nr:hypothetical protein FEM48_Zijuj01G0028100 [Ziziphus jujuba var. spinosa]
MATKGLLLLLLLQISLTLLHLVSSVNSLNRISFPADFVFGTASSAYQYEGAADQGGKGPSIWDSFTQRHPEKIKDRSSGMQAIDSYHRFKEDIGIMKDIGFDAYRFSISWSRLLPNGTRSGGVNKEGIKYYNDLINHLLSNGLEPFVTLFHWDLPQSLEDAYGGFLSHKIVKDFKNYAELCYREFGDRVKHWITLNEPHTFINMGYSFGSFPPGRCSNSCAQGNSGTEPYLVAHNLLLSHAAAFNVYKNKYQMSQNGQIGIALDTPWVVPLSHSVSDQEAANRALASIYGWFIESINFGHYPAEMVKYVGERLPKFSKEQSLMIKGSYDFIGINYYSAYYVTNDSCSTSEYPSYSSDFCFKISYERNGVPIGPKAASDWLYVYPQGIQDLLLYTKAKFNNPVIYITENGVDELNDGKLSLKDNMRIKYHSDHLSFVHSSIMQGVNVKGYFAWSLMDNFEWADGYGVRFGIVFVDYSNGLKRYPKTSAKWFKTFLH